jgi:hypothetical protein
VLSQFVDRLPSAVNVSGGQENVYLLLRELADDVFSDSFVAAGNKGD